MTASLLEFLILARAAGFFAMYYGVVKSVDRRGTQLHSRDIS